MSSENLTKRDIYELIKTPKLSYATKLSILRWSWEDYKAIDRRGADPEILNYFPKLKQKIEMYYRLEKEISANILDLENEYFTVSLELEGEK